MISFPEFENESMGGCQSFRYIPVIHTQSIANAINSVITSLPVAKAGKSILNGLSVMDMLSFLETHEESNAGSYHKTIIKGFVPKLTPAYIALFNELKRLRHHLIVADNNGYERIAYNLKFQFNQDTKDNPAGANGTTFQFYGESIEPSPFLVIS